MYVQGAAEHVLHHRLQGNVLSPGMAAGRTGWGECFDNQTRPLTYEIGPSE